MKSLGDMRINLVMYWLPVYKFYSIIYSKPWFDPALQITQRSAEETMLYNFDHVYTKNKGIYVLIK